MQTGTIGKTGLLAVFVSFFGSRGPANVLHQLMLFILLVSLFAGSTANASTSRNFESSRLSLPPSRINDPFDAPIYLTGFVAIGKSVDYESGLLGYGASILMRPGAAGKFLSFLYDYDLTIVLQADFQKIAQKRRILSGDLIVRKYRSAIVKSSVNRSFFGGIGLGGSELTVLGRESTSSPQYFSWLVEVGHEWKFGEKYIAFTKLQFRYYNHGEFNYSVWTLQCGAGMPLPW